MLTRCLFLAVLTVALPAQHRVSAVAQIVALGVGCPPSATARVLTSRVVLMELLEQVGWQGDVAEIDRDKRKWESGQLVLPLILRFVEPPDSRCLR